MDSCVEEEKEWETASGLVKQSLESLRERQLWGRESFE